MPMLKIQCCGVLEQICGGVEHEFAVSESPVQVTQALSYLADAVPDVADWLPRTACAVGDAIVSRDRVLETDETLVLLPPVSGG